MIVYLQLNESIDSKTISIHISSWYLKHFLKNISWEVGDKFWVIFASSSTWNSRGNKAVMFLKEHHNFMTIGCHILPCLLYIGVNKQRQQRPTFNICL